MHILFSTNFKKKYLIIFLLALIIFPHNIHAAATPTPASLVQPSQTWKCLKGNASTFTFIVGSTPSITQPVQGEGFPNDKEVYLVACAPTVGGEVCTSGNKNIDLRLFNVDNTYIPVTFKEGASQVSSYGKVSATAIVSGTQTGSGRYDFYGIFEDAGKVIATDDEKAQQQQTIIDFEGSASSCVSIAWANVNPPEERKKTPDEDGSEDDPYGVVFDSQSLEPLKNVTVAIYDSNKKLLVQRGLINPFTTKEDGLFNFLVPQGIYYLDVTQKAGYTFSASPNLNKNAELVYIKNNGKATIYKPGEPIVEKIDTAKERKQGYVDPERRDIPLDPGSSAPSHTTPVSMLYYAKKVGKKTEVFGRVSHPLTKVNLTQGTKTLTSVYANNSGFYTLTVNNSNISATDKLEVTFTKTDLTGDLSKIVNSSTALNKFELIKRIFAYFYQKAIAGFSTYAQTTSITIEPILSRIIGYAYDGTGKIIPNATVNVIVLNSKKAVYTTKADEKGFFTVPAKNIPPLSYKLEFVTPQGQKITKTTSGFAANNKEYLVKNNIQLNVSSSAAATKTTGNKSNNTEDKQESDINNVNAPITNKDSLSNKSAQTTTATTTTFYVLIILFLILISVGAGVWYFWNKKKQAFPQEEKLL